MTINHDKVPSINDKFVDVQKEPLVQEALKKHTSEIHKQAEKTDFLVALIKRKSISDKAYVQYLQDLYYVYKILESGLEENRQCPFIAPLCISEIYRAKKIKKDLDTFCTRGVLQSAPSISYQHHLTEISRTSPHRLIAHAYARYLGDLAGGQFICRRVMEIWPQKNCSSFYNFDELLENDPQIDPSLKKGQQLAQVRDNYRVILNSLQLTPEEKNDVIEEGIVAFQYAIDMMNAILSIPEWDIKTEVTDSNVYERLCCSLVYGDAPLLDVCIKHLSNEFCGFTFNKKEVFEGEIEVKSVDNKRLGTLKRENLFLNVDIDGVTENRIELILEKGIANVNNKVEFDKFITGIMPCISALTLSNEVNDKEIYCVYQCLLNSVPKPLLKKLTLRYLPEVSDESLEKLFSKSPHLKEVTLIRCSNISNLSITILEKYCKGIESLKISQCPNIKDQRLHSPFKLISQKFPNLKNLSINESNISEKSILKIVKKHPQITVLDFSSCEKINDKCIKKIVETMKQLTSLNISNCKNLSEESLEHIGNFDFLSQIFQLGIRGTPQISVEAFDPIRKNLHANFVISADQQISDYLYKSQ
ncbi:MAG: biliverdin-producing heme oxygenase [Chlamydiota bacterium]|nr:biliverdin-producing heme oxygenase [Chlamydiota bacterium]